MNHFDDFVWKFCAIVAMGLILVFFTIALILLRNIVELNLCAPTNQNISESSK
jgi:hypothetical protein